MTDEHPSQPVFLGSRTILVVDDVGVVRQLAFRMLSEAGFRVFEAGSAVEALEVLEMARGRIDLILVDVVLGEVNGVDLVRLLREKWVEPRIVYMSAHPAEVLVREGLANPSVHFLAKPFTREELMSIIYRAMQDLRRQNGESSEASRRKDV